MKAESEAAVAALAAAWNKDQVHRVGKVPASPVTPYAVVSVDTPRYTNASIVGRAGGRAWRIVAQYVGRNDEELDVAVEKGEAAYLNGKRLAIAGFDCTPVDESEIVSSPSIRDPDGGGYVTRTVLYPFAAYPA